MARTKGNPYPYFNSDVRGISPTASWNVAAAQPFFNPQYGLDTSTGRRDAERVAEALSANPFATGSESVQFGTVPSYEVAGGFDTNPYKQLISDLEKKAFGSEAKQQLLGLGSGLAFSAASLPLVERLRNLDYSLGLQADIESPTRQSERNLRLQQQQQLASSSVSDRLRALAAVRQGASSGFNLSA